MMICEYFRPGVRSSRRNFAASLQLGNEALVIVSFAALRMMAWKVNYSEGLSGFIRA